MSLFGKSDFLGSGSASKIKPHFKNSCLEPSSQGVTLAKSLVKSFFFKLWMAFSLTL